MRVGVDTGGTFTDVVDDQGRVAKVPSTPGDPAAAVRAAVADLHPDVLAHGTTVATNALLERRGSDVALITNAGLGDVIEIARQDRPSLYDAWADRPEALVVRSRRVEVAGRLDAKGFEIEPFDVEAIDRLDVGGATAVAVCLLHADLDAAHERAAADRLRRRGLDVTCSHEVSPELREYERTVTTVVNAYVRGPCRSYLTRLADVAPTVLVMTSAGGLVPVSRGAELPAALLLSGPAGGVAATAAVAQACGFPDVVTFDMGGTSTDVCLVQGGVPAPVGEREVGGFPVRLPSLDVHTIGAGGGSIAGIDPGGALVVGPASAGAVPGPACYGLGGERPTVTDADLVAGRLPDGAALPGIGALVRAAAERALGAAGVTAQGVLRVVDANMERAVRQVSVARGVDPRGLALVAFGGAGPLHVCSLADSLGMTTVIVPPRAGVLSAVGLLCGPRQEDRVRSWGDPRDHAGLEDALASLAHDALAALGADASGGAGGGVGVVGGVGAYGPIGAADSVEIVTAVDCRYAGQSHELRVPSVAAFAGEHRSRNGYDRPGTPVEVVAVRAAARVPAPLAVRDLPPLARSTVMGPAVVAEHDCTVWVPGGWRGEPDASTGALVLRRVSG